MPHFNGDAADTMRSDIAFLRERFEPWRQRYLKWERMVYPTFEDDVITARNPFLEPGRTEKNKRQKSQFRTNFIWSGCLGLVNWVSVSDLRVEMPIWNSEEENVRAAATERLIVGMLNMLDERVRRAGVSGTSWKRAVAAQAVVAGKIVGFPHLKRRTGRKEWEFTCDLYHPYQCYHDFRANGLRRFVYEETLDRSGIEAILMDERADEEAEFSVWRVPGWMDGRDGTYKVAHYWVEEPDGDGGLAVWRGIQVGDEPAMLRRTSFKRLPVVVQAINALGAVHQELLGAGGDVHSATFIERQAEPWYAGLENTIASYNDFRSLELDNIDWMVRPPLVTKPGEDGETWVIEDSRLGPGVQLNLRPGQIVEFLQVQSKAAEANATIAAAMLQEMNWVLPSAIRGEPTSANESGYHFDLRRNQQKLVLEDLHMACSAFTDRVVQELIQQFKDEKAEIDLSGVAITGKEMGHFFTERFSYSTILEGHPVRTYYAPAIPEDNMRAVMIYRQETESGALDKATARSRTMAVQDPVAVAARVQQDRLEERPEFQDRLIVSKFYDEAAALEQEATQTESAERRRLLLFEAKVARNWGELYERKLGGMGRQFQMEPQAGGPPPEVLPPQLGPENPEEMRAALGQPPPGGRPRGSLGAARAG